MFIAYQKEPLLGSGISSNVYKINNDAVKIYSDETKKISTYKFPIYIPREITINKMLSDCIFVPSIKEIYIGTKTQGFSMERYETTLYDCVKENKEIINNLQYIAFQITYCLAHAQSKNILHRDVKLDNILVTGGKLAISDWGLGLIKYGKHLEKSSQVVQTMHYRCPEHLCEMVEYYNNSTIDMWSVGIILVSIILKRTSLFDDYSQKSIITRIVEMIGYPEDILYQTRLFAMYGEFTISLRRKSYSKYIIKILKDNNIDEVCCDFISKLLIWNPKKRLDPISALNHPYLSKIYSDHIQIDATIFKQIENLPSHKINFSAINKLNPDYIIYRKYISDMYAKFIEENKMLSIHEHALMLLYTDKIMEKYSFTTFDFSSSEMKIFIPTIVNIVYVFSTEELFEPHTIAKILKYYVHSPEMLQSIVTYMNILNFPLCSRTFVTYDKLFDNLHNSIKYTYHIICKQIIDDPKIIYYDDDKIFSYILSFMKKIIYITKSLSEHVIYFSKELEEISKKYICDSDISLQQLNKNIFPIFFNSNKIIYAD